MSSDVMFVCRLTSCLSTDEITDRDTNDDRDIGNINDDRDTQRESDRDTRNVRLAMTRTLKKKLQTGTPEHK